MQLVDGDAIPSLHKLQEVNHIRVFMALRNT